MSDSSGGWWSRAQGHRLLKRAWGQIEGDLIEGGGPNPSGELLAWSIQTLMAAAGQAKHAEESRRGGGMRQAARLDGWGGDQFSCWPASPPQ